MYCPPIQDSKPVQNQFELLDELSESLPGLAMPQMTSASVMPQMPVASAMPSMAPQSFSAKPSEKSAISQPAFAPSSRKQMSQPQPKAAEMKSKKASSKPVQLKKASLDQLIAAQHPSGYWPETSKSVMDSFTNNEDCFDFDTIDVVNKAIEDCKMTNMRGTIITTLVALYILM
jgi:hypothetical protein